MKSIIKNLFALFPVFTIYFLFFMLLVPSLFFFMKIALNAWQVCIALFLTILFIYLWNKKKNIPPKRLLLYIIGCSSIFMFLGILFHHIYDSSFDGQWYHQEMIIALHDGWNPVYDTYYDRSSSLETIVNHYPKGIELIQALIYSVSGSIEAGKLIHSVCIIATFMVVLAYLKNKITNKIYLGMVSLLIALNPVAITQLTTFYVDGIIASLLTFLAILLLQFINRGTWMQITLIIMVSTILCTIKFTLLPYCALLGFTAFVFSCIKKKWIEVKYLLIYGIVTFVLAIGLIGFNPYIKNIKEKGEMFYPLKGENAMDIVTWLIPENFKGKGTVSQVILSLASQSEKTTDGKNIVPKIPFSVSKSELLSFSVPDTKIGGFGPFFGSIFWVSIIGLIVSVVLYRKYSFVFWFITPIIISILIVPQAWWARYVPQLWWIPIITIVVFITSEKKSVFRLSIVMATVLLLNCTMIFVVNVSSNLARSMIYKKKLLVFSQINETPNVYFGMYRSNILRFRNYDINFTEVMSKDQLKDGIQYHLSREVIAETSTPIQFYDETSFIDSILRKIEKDYIKNVQ